jgi:hypothetical protein
MGSVDSEKVNRIIYEASKVRLHKQKKAQFRNLKYILGLCFF